MRLDGASAAVFGVFLGLLSASGSFAGEPIESGGIEAGAGDRPYLAEQLEPFRPLLGKTYLGTFSSSTPEKPATDVQTWERALNGRAIRLLHSVNDGAYGGETIYMWDEAQEAVGFYYFTTLGFVTRGTIQFGDGSWSTREVVQGKSSATAVTEVESTGTFRSDGSILIQGRVLEDGVWREGDSVVYEEAPDATLIFR